MQGDYVLKLSSRVSCSFYNGEEFQLANRENAFFQVYVYIRVLQSWHGTCLYIVAHKKGFCDAGQFDIWIQTSKPEENGIEE